MVKKEHGAPELARLPPDHATKSKSAQGFTAQRRASAWPVHRWPLERFFAQTRTRVHLPLSYLARDGLATRTVHPGEDVNHAVYRFYAEDAKGGRVNYVHADSVDERRHEYLGPDPRVAGYYTDPRGELHVRWWDGFLGDQWMEEGKWTMEVDWDGGKWIEK
ncbi:hypothetical protein BDZ89DRAFT_958139 [Hymenopellis radicata]|nr:hypothetical protein BDZ89DRAFT_958139 [Hymenopellis radicata]